MLNRFLMMVCCALLLRPVIAHGQTAEELNFLKALTDFHQIRSMLPSYVNGRATALLQERSAEIGRISTKDGVEKRRTYTRKKMIEALGGLPERTPLNARTVAVLDREDYKIEKVIFESQPRFYVTANLYLPKNAKAPYPGILFPLGHEEGAKAHSAWQQVLVSLAKKGFAALAWDTLGQGERVQLYDPEPHLPVSTELLSVSVRRPTKADIQSELTAVRSRRSRVPARSMLVNWDHSSPQVLRVAGALDVEVFGDVS